MTHRHWLFSLSSVALLCVPLLGWGASVVITVPPEAQVQGPQITLGDVARSRANRLTQWRACGTCSWGRPHQPGWSGYSQRVRSSLSSNTRGCGRRRSSSREPSRSASGVPASVLIYNTWRPWCGRRSAGVSHRPRSALAFAIFVGSARSPCRSDQLQYEVTVPGRHMLLGSTSFTLSIQVAGKVAKQLHGTATIAVAQEVVSLVRPVAQGEIITADAVSRTQVQVTQPLRQVMTQPAGYHRQTRPTLLSWQCTAFHAGCHHSARCA